MCIITSEGKGAQCECGKSCRGGSVGSHPLGGKVWVKYGGFSLTQVEGRRNMARLKTLKDNEHRNELRERLQKDWSV